MMKEEKIIRNLRNRRKTIIGYAGMALVFAAGLAFAVHAKVEVDNRITPEVVSKMATFENLKSELPSLLCKFYKLADANSALGRGILLFAVCLGCMIGELVNEITGMTQRRVIVSMWDRLQELERKLGNGQPPPSGDSSTHADAGLGTPEK